MPRDEVKKHIKPGIQAYDVIATEPGGIGERILREVLPLNSERNPLVNYDDWKEVEPGVWVAQKTVSVSGGDIRSVRFQIGDTKGVEGRVMLMVEDNHHNKFFSPERGRVRINPSRRPNMAENSVRAVGFQAVAAAVAHGNEWTDRSGALVPQPWGPPKGLKGKLVKGDRERVLRAHGARLLGPELSGKGPLRLHVPMCPNRNEDMSAISTRLSQKKTRALIDLIASIERYVDQPVDVTFYVFNGETARDPMYLRLNYPGLWDKSQMPEWCERAYTVTKRMIVDPLGDRLRGSVSLIPMHEVMGDLTIQPLPSDDLVHAAHDAYDKFATDRWSNGEMAMVTQSDFRLNWALFSKLERGDVVLTSNFHVPIFERAYSSPLRKAFPEAGLLAVSRNTLFLMAVD